MVNRERQIDKSCRVLSLSILCVPLCLCGKEGIITTETQRHRDTENHRGCTEVFTLQMPSRFRNFNSNRFISP